MAYVGDISTDVTDRLTLLNQAAKDIQTGFDQLAQKLTSAGNAAVRVSNQTTGAAAGAKVGATTGGIVPANVSELIAKVPTPVLYGGIAYILYRALR